MSLGSRSRFALRLALTLAIVTVLAMLARDERVGEALASLSGGAIAAAVILNIIASIVVPAVVTYQTQGGKALGMSLWQLTRINFAIRFYAMVLPSATVTGVRWYRYQRASSRSSAAALVVLEKLVQLFVYGAVALVCAAVQYPQVGSRMLPFAAVLGAVTALSGGAVITFFSSRFDPLLLWFRPLSRARWIGGPIRKVSTAAAEARGGDVSVLPALIGWSALSFGLFVASGWVLLADLGLVVPLFGLAWIRGTVFMASNLPFTVAGIGVREAGFVGLLGLYGVDRGSALGFALALLLVQVIIGAVGGLLEAAELLRPSSPSAAVPQSDTSEVTG